MIRKRLLSLSILLLLTFNILAVLNLSTIGVSAVEYPAMYVDPPSIIDPTLTPGKNFTVSIKTNYNGSDIQAYQFTLSYNASILHGVEVTNGDLITTNKHPSAMFMRGTFNNVAGELSQTGAFFFFIVEPAPMTSGPGTLANVTFTVVGIGESDITIGPVSKLIGYTEDGYGDPYDIINAQTMLNNIGHGYFDNRGAPPFHDVAVDALNVTVDDRPLDKPVVAGRKVNINVTVRNGGNVKENVTVTVSYNISVIDARNITLAPGKSRITEFSWDTPNVTVNTNYTITAEATIEDEDQNLGDNTQTTLIKLAVRHDVSIKDGIEALTSAIIGDIVSINVTVENQGSYNETVTVTVEGTPAPGGIGNKTFTLKALANKTVSFNWTTTGLTPDDYTIKAHATIDEDADWQDDDEEHIITLALGHDVAVTNILFPPTVYVGNFVNIGVHVGNLGGYNETDIELKVTYDSNPIGNQSVNLTSGVFEYFYFNWSTADVAPGSYEITAEAILHGDANENDNLMTSYPNLIDVKMPPGTINGTVTDASTADPIEGANITTNGYSATTDANGHYKIANIPNGTYTVTVSADSYESSTKTIKVTAGETTTQNFTLTPFMGTITGKVTDSLKGDPIAGATVTAGDYINTTDAEGHYSIELPPQTYNVTASATKYVDQSKTVTVTANTTKTLHFALTPLNGTISGTVTDSSTGNPIAGATVTANGISVSTGADGSYSIELAPRTYNVTVSADGYEDSSQLNVTITSGEPTTVNFELTPVQPLNILLYAGVAAIAIIIIATITVYILKIRKPK